MSLGARRAFVALLLAVAPHAAASAVLEPLRAAIARNYQPPPQLASEAAALAAAGAADELAGLPRLSLTERLTAAAYQNLSLAIDLDLDVPIYRSLAAPRAAVQAARERDLAASSALAAAEAHAHLLVSALALALTTELERAANAALTRFRAEVWDPPATTAGALEVKPSDRELLGLYRSVERLEQFAAAQAAEYARRLERGLAVPVERLPLPSFDDAYRALDRAPPEPGACLLTSPQAAAALRRHEQRLLTGTLERTPDFDVTLSANLAYQATSGHATAAGGVSGGLVLTARLQVPDGWPLAGAATASASLDGAQQRLSLTWPRPPRLGLDDPSAVEAEAARVLADDLERLADHVAGLLRERREAAATLEDAELRLRWLALDARQAADPRSATDPQSATDPRSAAALARGRFPDPVAELRAVALGADLAFARLALVSNTVALEVVCGGAFGLERSGSRQ